MEGADLAIGLRAGALVQLAGQARALAPQLQVGGETALVESALRERRAHRASGLRPVRAVAEAAARGQCLDVLEGGVEPRARLPQLQLAHAGRVHHERARRQYEQ